MWVLDDTWVKGETGIKACYVFERVRTCLEHIYQLGAIRNKAEGPESQQRS